MEPEIQLAPLIDVILLLLLFYSVAANFTDQSSLNIELPRAGSAPSEQQHEALVVAVESDGGYSVNGRAVADVGVDALMNAMARALKAGAPDDTATAHGSDVVPALGSTRRVTIVGDASAPHQAVVRAMDAARRLGIASVSIATRAEHE